MEEVKQLRYKGEFQQAFVKLQDIKLESCEYWVEYLLNGHYVEEKEKYRAQEQLKKFNEELIPFRPYLKAVCTDKELLQKLDQNLNNPFIVIYSTQERKKRMEQRFKQQELQPIFVEGVKVKEEWKDFKYPGAIACRQAHLKAYSYFLQEGKYKDNKGAFFVEDDALFHKDFKDRVCNIELGDQLLFSPIVWPCHNKKLYQGNLYHLGKYVASACCYWLSRPYMEKILKRFDKPLDQYDKEYVQKPIDDILNDEGEGYYYYPPIAIEDGLSSVIDNNNFNERIFSVWKKYNLNNFIYGDYHPSRLYEFK